MINYPLVSIVVACYNGINFLEQQLNSLDTQEYPNLEVIIVDDASTDGSYECLTDYVATRSNYRLIRNETNHGLVATFDKAINLARGDYIALCDQDDIWFPNKIQQLMSNIDESWLIHSDANLINQHGVVFQGSYFASCKHEISSYAQYLIENNVTGCTCLFRKKLLVVIDNHFPQGVTVHDRILAILAAKINGIKYLNQVLMSYRQHSANQVGAISQINNKLVMQRHLQDLNALSNHRYFLNDIDIKFAQRYYRVLQKKERVTFKLLVWVLQQLGIIWCLKFILKSILK
jgi:glycosyltransferase involved in cell wall biosynthesis